MSRITGHILPGGGALCMLPESMWYEAIHVTVTLMIPLDHIVNALIGDRVAEGADEPVGLGKIARLINAGKIDSSELITMKTLKDTGAIGKQIRDGVRLMGRGAEQIQWPIHLEVSRVTVRAKEAVEAAGGSVRKVYYNQLGFRALLKPEWFEKKGRLIPKAARPPPKQMDKVDSIGRLPAPTKPIPFAPEMSA
ncbi:50S ribosomal protein L15-like protein [Tanacetum coccineum]